MVPVLFNLEQATFLIKGPQSKQVLGIKVRLFHRDQLIARIKLAEPRCLFRKDHRIRREKNHCQRIKLREPLLIGFGGRTLLFVIEIRQENGLIEIVLVLLEVANVVRGTQGVLHEFVVRVQQRYLFNIEVYLAPKLLLVTRAVRAQLHAVVGRAHSHEIVDWVLGRAGFHDEAADESALRYAHYVELPLTEDRMLQNLAARLLGLLDHGGEYGGFDAVADLDALHYATGALADGIDIFYYLIFPAALFETMEDHCGRRLVSLRTLPRL